MDRRGLGLGKGGQSVSLAGSGSRLIQTNHGMKKPLSWHLECLNNQKLYLERKRQEAERLKSEFEDLRIKVEQYETKIERARAMGKDGFDAEKFIGNT